jgi:hypothetical protein
MQSINPLCISKKQGFTLLGSGRLGQSQSEFHPTQERASEGADRPVAAPEDAIPPEAVDGVVDEWLQIADRPPVGAGVRNDSANFANDIGFGRHGLNMLFPRMKCLLADVRSATMIKDEGRLGKLLHELKSQRQLTGLHAQIEGQAVL